VSRRRGASSDRTTARPIQSSVSNSERPVINPERTSRLWTNHPSVRKGRLPRPGLAIGQRSYPAETTNFEEFLQLTLPPAGPRHDRLVDLLLRRRESASLPPPRIWGWQPTNDDRFPSRPAPVRARHQPPAWSAAAPRSFRAGAAAGRPGARSQPPPSDPQSPLSGGSTDS